MQTLFLDGSRYETGRDVHLAFKRLLHLPEYYGCNADALFDCLAERKEKVNLVVLDRGNEAVSATLEKCMAVVEDLGGSVKVLEEEG